MIESIYEQLSYPRGKVQQQMQYDLQGLPPFQLEQQNDNWGNLFKSVFTKKEKQISQIQKGLKSIKFKRKKEESFTLFGDSDFNLGNFRRNSCPCLQCGQCSSKQNRINKRLGNTPLIQQHLKDELFTIHRRAGVLWKMKTILLKHTKFYRTINYWTLAANRRKSQLDEVKYCYEINNKSKQRKSSWMIQGQNNEKRRKAVQARQSNLNNNHRSIIKIDQNNQIIRVKQIDPAEGILKAKDAAQKQESNSSSSNSSDSSSLATIKEIPQRPNLMKKKPSQSFQFKLSLLLLATQKPSQSVQNYVKQRYKEHRKLIKKQQTTLKFITSGSSFQSYPSVPILPQISTPKKNNFSTTYLSNSKRFVK